MADWIDGVNDRLGRFVSWLIMGMVAIGSYNALVRYVGRWLGWRLSSNAYLELQWYLFAFVFLLGAAYTLRHNAHVRVDVFYGRLTPRRQAWIDLVGHVLFLIPFCILMLWASWAPVHNSWSILESSPDPGGLPRYPIKTLIPIAFFLLLLQGLSEVIKVIAYLRGHLNRASEHVQRGEL